jgi:hypothetical protein
LVGSSVADPNPDPYVFGPPGSGSINQRYGSGSLYHQAKIVRIAFIPTVLRLLFDLLSLIIVVNVPSKSNGRKNFKKLVFLLESLRSVTKIAGSGSICQRRGSTDPDPHPNGMDPQHWLADTVPFSPLFVFSL